MKYDKYDENINYLFAVGTKKTTMTTTIVRKKKNKKISRRSRSYTIFMKSGCAATYRPINASHICCVFYFSFRGCQKTKSTKLPKILVTILHKSNFHCDLKIVTVYTHTYSNVCGCVHIYSEFNTHTATHIILTKSNSERFETIQCVQPQRAVKGKRHDKDACRYINDTFSDLRYRDESQEQETKRTNKLARAHKRVREAH